MDARSARNSRTIEPLGFYDPIEKDDAKAVNIKEDRVKYWLSVGAQPSNTVSYLLKKQENSKSFEPQHRFRKY